MVLEERRLMVGSGLCQSDVDVLPATCPLTMEDTQGNGECATDAGAVVIQQVRLSKGRTVTAEAVHQSGDGLRVTLEAAVGAHRATVTVGAEREVHHVRFSRADLVVGDAVVLGHALGEVLHHHVGLIQELSENLKAAGRVQVEEQGLLAAVQVLVLLVAGVCCAPG
jgi:hypothetical protein